MSETLLTSEGLERIHDVLTHRRSIVYQILMKNGKCSKTIANTAKCIISTIFIF